ncbi:MAG: hypothetical protein JXB60_05785 [Candidatus Cloacimonetes bacterium]|nr:hypothetical protein [Candidatus Cloacimonadota bacterium]
MRRLFLLLAGVRLGKRVKISRKCSIGAGTEIGYASLIESGTRIGLQVSIGENVLIGEGVVIGDGTVLQEGCQIMRNSVIGKNCRMSGKVWVGENCRISRVEVGENTHIEDNVIFTGVGEGRIRIGRESYIGIGTVLDWSDNISIGNFVHIAGPSTGIWTHTGAPMCLHGIALAEKGKKYRPTAPVQIEDNVYIGGNCTVYPGRIVSHHSIVAPNSAVTNDVGAFTLWGGVPARKIKDLEIE